MKIVLFSFLIAMISTKVSFSENITSSVHDSNMLCSEMAVKLLNDPTGIYAPLYASGLIRLNPVIGRTKIYVTLLDALKKTEASGSDFTNRAIMYKFLIDSLQISKSKNYIEMPPLTRWFVSGPWQRYGVYDFDYTFQPEAAIKISNAKRTYRVSTDQYGYLYPFPHNHAANDIIYASTSILSTDIILSITSNCKFIAFVNGKEIFRTDAAPERLLNIFRISGAKGYNLLFKIQKINDTPFIKVAAIDEKTHTPLSSGYDEIYIHHFTSEQLYSSDYNFNTEHMKPLIREKQIHSLIQKGEYYKGYISGKELITEFPAYYNGYKILIPLLDIMNRDEEFFLYLNQFMTIFPDSEISNLWYADFYRSRDKNKFMQIMEHLSYDHATPDMVMDYAFMLCEEKKYNEALSLCEKSSGIINPNIISSYILKRIGDKESLRKHLIESALKFYDQFYYNMLGNEEIPDGLDPVIYWEKGLSMQNNSFNLKDKIDLFENKILSLNNFYTGNYSNINPEFIWPGSKRNIKLHISHSATVFIEGEEIIPGDNKIFKNYYGNNSPKIINWDVPFFEGIKILYIIKISEGIPEAIDFNTTIKNNGRCSVSFPAGKADDFYILKYSGEYCNNIQELFKIVSNFKLKFSDEEVSELNLEVICSNDFKPRVIFNESEIHPEKFSNDEYIYKTGYTYLNKERVDTYLDIFRFSSDIDYIRWYRELLNIRRNLPVTFSQKLINKTHSEQLLKDIHLYVTSSVIPENESGEKTEYNIQLEKILLSMKILNRFGIKSFISFIKKDTLKNQILLYIPINKAKGFWLSYSKDTEDYKNSTNYTALILTEDGYKTINFDVSSVIR